MGKMLSKNGGIDAQYLAPHGDLYNECEWDLRVVKKLIVDKKLAPFYPGQDDEGPDVDECPICFLNYPGGLNYSRCCDKPLCSECFLQVKTPDGRSTCPFCNNVKFGIVYRGPKPPEVREAEERERQRILEIQIRAREEERLADEERSRKRREERLRREEAKARGEDIEAPNADEEPEYYRLFQSVGTPPARSDPVRAARSSGGGGSGSRSRSRSRRGASGSPSSPPIVMSAPARSSAPRSARSERRTGSSRTTASRRTPHRTTRHLSGGGGQAAAASAAVARLVPEEMLRNINGAQDVANLEELMIMEAIRASLAEAEPQPAAVDGGNGDAAPLADRSASADSEDMDPNLAAAIRLSLMVDAPNNDDFGSVDEDHDGEFVFATAATSTATATIDEGGASDGRTETHGEDLFHMSSDGDGDDDDTVNAHPDVDDVVDVNADPLDVPAAATEPLASTGPLVSPNIDDVFASVEEPAVSPVDEKAAVVVANSGASLESLDGADADNAAALVKAAEADATTTTTTTTTNATNANSGVLVAGSEPEPAV